MNWTQQPACRLVADRILLLEIAMKTQTRRRIHVLGLIGALAAVLSWIPEAQAQPQRGAGALVPLRAVAPLPPSSPWHGIAAEPSAKVQMKRNVLVLLSELTGDRVLRRVASRPRPPTLPVVTDSLAQERARRRGTFVEIAERRGFTPIITSKAVQVAYASSGAALFAAGIVASKVLSGGRSVTAYPHPWPAGIHISGSF